MTSIPYRVAEAFYSQHKPARAGAFVSVGDALYSYGLKLAHWQDGQLILDCDLTARAPSVTTARHIKALRSVLKLLQPEEKAE